ncbi:5957_t:CDS:2, partial [Scutellospora calospora]
TNSSFDSVSDFIGNNIYTRGDAQVRYTSKAYINDSIVNALSKLITPPRLPWTEKDIIILTNGICLSTCAIITQRLAEINVPTISVGGFPNKRFSFAAFAVGSAVFTSDLKIFLKQLKNLNSSLISKLTLSSDLTMHFVLSEAYSIKNPNEIMDFSYRPADYQLYYDECSARDPSKLWIQAAKYIGNNI